MTHTTRRGALRALSLAAGGAVAASSAGCTAVQDAIDPQDRPSATTDGPPAAAVSDAAAALPPTAAATFRGGLRRQGLALDVPLPGRVDIDWAAPVNTGEHTAAKSSAVRTADGSYIIPGDTGTVTRFTADGRVEWTAATEPSTRGIHGTPTLVGDLVHVGAYDGALYAFDVETGERQWRTQLGDAIGSSPAYHDGVVYIAVEHDDPDGSVAGVDAVTGAVLWTDDWPTDHPHSIIGIDVERGVLAFGSNDGYLYGWDYPSTERRWRFETGGAIKGPIAIHDGSAFFGSWDDHVYRVSLEDGTEEWSFDAGAYVMSGAAIDEAAGLVYVGSHANRLHALSLATGEEVWSHPTDGRVIGCPTLTADGPVVGSYGSRVYALDRDGDLHWETPVPGGRVTCEPYVDADGIVVTSRAAGNQPGTATRLVGVE